MEDTAPRLVGIHAKTGDEVYQDSATGLLYYLGPPRKQYVGLHEVSFGSNNPTKPKKSKKKKQKKAHLELVHSIPPS